MSSANEYGKTTQNMKNFYIFTKSYLLFILNGI